jgi:diacylglycerol O-acyltransferase
MAAVKKKYLDPLDFGFLLTETRQQMMHVGSLMFYKVPEGQNADEVATGYHQQMLEYDHAYNPFNYKLSTSLGRPCWVEDEDFDILNHVRHVRLPWPGDIKELLRLVGVLHGLQLDRSLPLWIMWVISGLPDNRFAVYSKIHHALIDGVSGARLIAKMHAKTPDEDGLVPLWARDWQKEKTKGGSPVRVREDSLLRMSKNVMATTLGFGSDLVKSNTKVGKLLLESWSREKKSAFRSNLYYAPPTILNQKITGARRFVADSYSLTRMKAAGKAFGGSVNDCMLAMIGYAMRKYLKDLKQLPKENMVAIMPVNLREDDSIGGNQISMIRASLGTAIPQTKRRLAHIVDEVEVQKNILRKLNKEEKLMYGLGVVGPSLLHLGTGMVPSMQGFNLMLSNVPGPKDTLYWNGLELDAMYPVSIPAHQMAVNITVMSYRDNLEVGIVACRVALPRIQRLIDYLHEGLDDIERVTGLAGKKS